MTVMNDSFRCALMDRLRDNVASDGIMLTEIHAALDAAYREGAEHAATEIAKATILRAADYAKEKI